MADIKINSLNAIIQRIKNEIERNQDGNLPMTLSRISERVPIDRKTLRKWLKAGIIHAELEVKCSYHWDNGKLVVASKPNGIYRMTLSRLLKDLQRYNLALS